MLECHNINLNQFDSGKAKPLPPLLHCMMQIASIISYFRHCFSESSGTGIAKTVRLMSKRHYEKFIFIL